MVRHIGKWWEGLYMWQRYALSIPLVPLVLVYCTIMAVKFLAIVIVGASEELITEALSKLVSNDYEGPRR